MPICVNLVNAATFRYLVIILVTNCNGIIHAKILVNGLLGIGNVFLNENLLNNLYSLVSITSIMH